MEDDEKKKGVEQQDNTQPQETTPTAIQFNDPPTALDNTGITTAGHAPVQTIGETVSIPQSVQDKITEAGKATALDNKSVKREEPKRTPYDWAEQFLPGKMMTEEEKAKQEKRERQAKIFSAIGDGIAAMSNVIFATKGAPDMYDPTKSMSATTKKYWDDLNKERQADENLYFNARLNLDRIKDAYEQAKAEKQHRKEREKVQDAQWNQMFNFNQQKERAAQDYKDRALQVQADKLQYIKEKDKADADQKKAQLDEAARQFDAKLKLDGKQLALSWQKLHDDKNSGMVDFSLGEGMGTVRLSNATIKANIGQLFATLPEEIRANIKGTPDSLGRPTAPTDDAMLLAVGHYISQSPETQKLAQQLAGKSKPKLY